MFAIISPHDRLRRPGASSLLEHLCQFRAAMIIVLISMFWVGGVSLFAQDLPDVAMFPTVSQTSTSIDVSDKNSNYVAYASSAGGDITWAISTDGGATWSGNTTSPQIEAVPPLAISQTPSVRFDRTGSLNLIGLQGLTSVGAGPISANIVTDGTDATTAYSTQDRICLLRTTDRGSSWTGSVVTGSQYPNSPARSFLNNQDACIDGSGRVHVVWTGGERVRISTSVDGLTWPASPTVFVSMGGEFHSGPKLAEGPGGIVYLVWYSLSISHNPLKYIWFSRSTNGGANWDLPRVAFTFSGYTTSVNTYGNSTGEECYPSTAVDRSGGPRNGSLYAVYANVVDTAKKYADIVMKVSTDQGTTWSSSSIQVSEPGAAQRRDPSITVDRATGDLWVSYSTGANNVRFMAYSSDGGGTWQRFQVKDATSGLVSGTNHETQSFGGRVWTSWNGYISKAVASSITLRNQSPANGAVRLYEAMTSIVAGPSFASGGNTTMYVATSNGTGIRLVPGFSASSAGNQTFRAYIGNGTVLNLAGGTAAEGNIPAAPVRSPLVVGLLSSYPNPFNPATRIDYTVPFAGRASLAVYDLLGKEVARLVNDEREAGTYSTEWNAGQRASGIYFARLTVTDNNGNQVHSRVQRLLLMK